MTISLEFQRHKSNDFCRILEHNKKNGKGVYQRFNGERLEGVWIKDKKNGNFTITNSQNSEYQGCEITGRFEEDERNGVFQIRNRQGACITETWTNGKKIY